MSTTEEGKKPLDPRAKAYADADLNQLLESLKTLENIDIAAMLNYVQLIQKGAEQLKVFAVKKASETYMSSAEMAKQLDISRQTFANQMRNTIDKHRAEKQENPAAFRNRLGETDRFIDGHLTKAANRLVPADFNDMTDNERMYFGGFCKALNTELQQGNAEGVKSLFAEALRDNAIAPLTMKDLQKRAEAFLAGSYDYDELGEPSTFSKAEHEWARLRALGSICGLTDAQKKQLAKAKAKMAQEQADLDKQMRKETGDNPFSGFNLPRPTPASSKLPKNLLEDWEEYQATERAAGRRPTMQGYADKLGVSRPTLSRGIKKAKEKANEQE